MSQPYSLHLAQGNHALCSIVAPVVRFRIFSSMAQCFECRAELPDSFADDPCGPDPRTRRDRTICAFRSARLRCWPKALWALGSALDKVTPIKLAGKFWRVIATSSLLGLLRGENGLIDGSTHLLVLRAESRWTHKNSACLRPQSFSSHWGPASFIAHTN
jgi:hypothetical protein